MQIAALPPLSLRDLAPPQAQSDQRTPGLHLTDITGVMLAAIAPARYGRSFDATSRENYQETGFMWEELLTPVFAARATARDDASEIRFRPGEVIRDGVIGSPDAVVFREGVADPIVEEYKATWKSCRDLDTPTPGAGLADEKFLGYLLQLQGYCHMLQTTHARLYILFLNGDYTTHTPEVRGYELEFTRQGLAEQWASFLNTARAEGWTT